MLDELIFSIFASNSAEVPEAPEFIRPKSIGSDSVTLEWRPPKNDGGSRVTGYKVKMREEGSEDWKDVASLKPYDTEYTVRKLSTGKGYDFCILAENEIGAGNSVETEKTITPQKKPGKTQIYWNMHFELI